LLKFDQKERWNLCWEALGFKGVQIRNSPKKHAKCIASKLSELDCCSPQQHPASKPTISLDDFGKPFEKTAGVVIPVPPRFLPTASLPLRPLEHSTSAEWLLTALTAATVPLQPRRG